MIPKWPVLIFVFVFALRSLVAAPDPALDFREDWKDDTGKLSNPALALALYGPGSGGIEIGRSAAPAVETYLSMGGCRAHCAFTLRDRNNYFNLTNPDSRIRWRTVQDGFYEFKVVIRLASGTWLISDHNQGGLPDWTEAAYTIKGYHWYRFNIDTFGSGPEVLNPDFQRVDQIGCACSTADDASCESSTPGTLRLDWMEVYGALEPRP